MIQGASTKRLFESLGPAGFVRKTRELLGLSRDRFGRPVVQDPQLSPDEFSLRDLAESLVGSEWTSRLAPGSDGANLMEMDTAVAPSAFTNISAWSATVGGLLEAKVLEEYRRPEYIADRLVRVLPTRQRSEKLVGISAVGDLAEEMAPGAPHPRAQFGERYVTTPETKKFGLAIDVTREAVFFDLTRQVMTQAENVGRWLGLRKEKRVLDVVLGITNTYSYRGTTYGTYLTSGNWINSHSNPLADWTDLDAALQLFAAMTDQETGERVLVTPSALLVMPYKQLTAGYVLNATEIETRTSSASEIRRGRNPLAGQYQVLSSPIAYQRLTDADGGNLAANVARDYWFFGDFARAFGYMENWALSVERTRPDDYTMRDRNLLVSVFANEMGTPAVLEPRQVVRNVN